MSSAAKVRKNNYDLKEECLLVKTYFKNNSFNSPESCYRASNSNTSGPSYIETEVAEKDISGNHHLIWKVIYHLKISSYSAPGKKLEKKKPSLTDHKYKIPLNILDIFVPLQSLWKEIISNIMTKKKITLA